MRGGVVPTKTEPAAIIQPSLDLEQAKTEIQALLGRINDGESVMETAQKALHEWRCQVGALLKKLRPLYPERGPKAAAWGEFVSSCGLTRDTASNYIKLADHRDRYPVQAASMSTMDVYRAIGVAPAPGGGRSASANPPAKLPEKEKTGAPPRKEGKAKAAEVSEEGETGEAYTGLFSDSPLRGKPKVKPPKTPRSVEPQKFDVKDEAGRAVEEAPPLTIPNPQGVGKTVGEAIGFDEERAIAALMEDFERHEKVWSGRWDRLNDLYRQRLKMRDI